MTKTAIMVDGGFYQKRANHVWGKLSPTSRANELIAYCMNHLKDENEQRTLYRIFYYDCPPLNKKLYHPLTQKPFDLGATDLFKWMTDFLGALKKKRKVALRLGHLAEGQASYSLKPDVLKKLCAGTMKTTDLTEGDFNLDVAQKGVDMKIGLDIASMAHKKQANQIVLIAGDSDFVPAAKHARREGIDFILDPMRASVRADLLEHIDGLKTWVPKQTSEDV